MNHEEHEGNLFFFVIFATFVVDMTFVRFVV